MNADERGSGKRKPQEKPVSTRHSAINQNKGAARRSAFEISCFYFAPPCFKGFGFQLRLFQISVDPRSSAVRFFRFRIGGEGACGPQATSKQKALPLSSAFKISSAYSAPPCFKGFGF
jgi:hypothetical protein